MIQTFNEYVLDWWHDFLDGATDKVCDGIMQSWIGEEEHLSDYIPSDASDSREWLQENVTDAEVIYTTFFGLDGSSPCDEIPSTSELLTKMFTQAVQWPSGDVDYTPTFTRDFIIDMINHTEDYSTPDGFFQDLAYGGCVSGMIGLLIYNSDCRKIYIEHIDDMETFKLELEDGLGEAIRNDKQLPHYTFMCWLCYEELARIIACNLFPEQF